MPPQVAEKNAKVEQSGEQKTAHQLCIKRA